MKNQSKNLCWYLDNLATSEAEQFESGSLEILGENEDGAESSIEVAVADLADAASSRIKELETALSRVLTIAKLPYETATGVRDDIVEHVNDCLADSAARSEEHAVLALRMALQDAEELTGDLVRTESGQPLTGAVLGSDGITLTED